MIEQAVSETYYYHYDALGSVIALSDSSGDTVQTYEYSVFGQPVASDVDFPNPYMFAGRRFDIEIGLYYNRARYYNPFIGRFLQADPIGYQAGMNMYAYCWNNPLVYTDPSGCDPCYIKVMFYGQEDSWEEYANDSYFDFYYQMEDFNTVEDKLSSLREDGYIITDVYFIDHCMNWESWPNNRENPEIRERVYGLKFGTSALRFDDGSLEKAMRSIDSILGEGYHTIHFRHCFLGKTYNYDRLADLVEWTGGPVSAVNGMIEPSVPDENGFATEVVYHHPDGNVTIDVPDYHCEYGYVMAFPLYVGGGAIGIIPYNERTDLPYRVYAGLPMRPY